MGIEEYGPVVTEQEHLFALTTPKTVLPKVSAQDLGMWAKSS